MQFVESKHLATGVDRFRGDKENTIVHRHESRVASSSRWLGISEASDSDAPDIPLHRIFNRDRRIEAPIGIADPFHVGGFAL